MSSGCLDITIRSIDLPDGSSLILNKPLVINPVISRDGVDFFVVDIPELSLNVFARSRAELINEVNEQLSIIWQEYALAPDSILSLGAQQLKQNILAHITKIDI